jgi:hypothetical protein
MKKFLAATSIVLCGVAITATADAGRAKNHSTHRVRVARHVDTTVRPNIKVRGKTKAVKAAKLLRGRPTVDESVHGSKASVLIYLNPSGGILRSGQDDPANDISSIAAAAGSRVSVPAFTGGARQWSAISACVAKKYRDFAVDFTDRRPTNGDYTMIMVGGSPSMISMNDQVAGIAPADGTVLRNAVGFVFSEGSDDVSALCDAIVHEAGHTLGLDHSMQCEDPMSYQFGCGEKHFTNVSVSCGEYEDRDCQDGAATQNSYVKLATLVGLRNRSDVPVAPGPEATAPQMPQPSNDDSTMDPYVDQNDHNNQLDDIDEGSEDFDDIEAALMDDLDEIEQIHVGCSQN